MDNEENEQLDLSIGVLFVMLYFIYIPIYTYFFILFYVSL